MRCRSLWSWFALAALPALAACSSGTPPEPTEEPDLTARWIVSDEPIQIEEGLACRPGAPAPGLFVDAHQALGLGFVHNPYPEPDPHDRGGWVLEDFAGVAVADLDGDGWLDLVFAQGKGNPGLFLTGGRGPLRYESVALVVSDSTRVVTVVDYDGDGDRDLLFVTKSEPLAFLNRGDGRFTEVRQVLPPRAAEPSLFSATFGDLDGDGLLDLYLGNQQDFSDDNAPYTPGAQILLAGQGAGDWRDRSTVFPKTLIEGLTFEVALLDIDGDGDLDIYEANDSRPLEHLGIPYPGGDLTRTAGNRLLRNDSTPGSFVLTDVTAASGASTVIAAMGLAVGDYDNDGRPDFYVPTMPPDRNALFHNLGDLRFEDVTAAAGAHTLTPQHDVGWGAIFVDADMDGLQDLYVMHGFIEAADHQFRQDLDAQPNVFLRNQGDGTFSEMIGTGLSSSNWSRSPVVGDLDRDGFPDIVVGNAGAAPHVFLNGCDSRPWLTVRLEQRGANRDAIGAVVTASAAGVTQTRWIRAGGDGLFGCSAPEAYFGFSGAVVDITLQVRWPDGAQDQYQVPARRIVTLRH